MTLHHRKESPETLEALMSEARFGNSIPHPAPNSSGQAIAAQVNEDGLPLVLCAVVCLSGPWAGSDKGAT